MCVCVGGVGCPGAWTCTCACERVALFIQHASRKRHILWSFVASPAVSHFSTLFHKQHNFRKKNTERKICALILSATFIWNVSQCKKN
jgi:hypothetical protein